MSITPEFWKNKRVFITGHTGFKGAWLCLWLHSLGAKVTGYSLAPPTNPNLFSICDIANYINSIIGDVRDFRKLKESIEQAKPEIVIHMAAQPLVRESYLIPVETYEVNVMGTVNILEAIRQVAGVRSFINVTTDKCYENNDWVWGYRENDQLGGHDPYSNSKACSELVTAAYRNSFFGDLEGKKDTTAIATARAGNVIGGGDWAKDRLISDIMLAVSNETPVVIRNPQAIRPWQHVLEPLSGYLELSKKLYENGAVYADSWNFGPKAEDAKPVRWIVEKITKSWGNNTTWELDGQNHPHEATYLKLDCSKAQMRLGWSPIWDLDKALDATVTWYRSYFRQDNMYDLTLAQIKAYSMGRS